MTRKAISVLGGRGEGLRLERVRASKQCRGGRFANTAKVSSGLKGNPLPTMGEFFFGGQNRTPPGPLPVLDPRAAWQRSPDTGLRITWLGHSTMLLELDGARILT